MQKFRNNGEIMVKGKLYKAVDFNWNKILRLEVTQKWASLQLKENFN